MKPRHIRDLIFMAVLLIAAYIIDPLVFWCGVMGITTTLAACAGVYCAYWLCKKAGLI